MPPSESKPKIQDSENKESDRNQENEKHRSEDQNAIEGPLDRLANEFVIYKQEQQKADIERRRRETATIFGLFATVALTLILAMAAIAQAYAFIQSERAELDVSRFQILGGTLDPTKQVGLIFYIKNAGKSAAEVVGVSVTLRPVLAVPLEYDKLLEVAANRIPAGGEGANIYLGTSKAGIPFFMTQKYIDNINSGVGKLYVYGFVEYFDHFSWFRSFFGPIRSDFCFLYLPQLGTPSNSAFGGCPLTDKY